MHCETNKLEDGQAEEEEKKEVPMLLSTGIRNIWLTNLFELFALNPVGFPSFIDPTSFFSLPSFPFLSFPPFSNSI